MPVSKKRKRKDGTVAKFKRDRHEQRRRQIQADVDAGAYGTDSGVSLQDLINVVAYQEYREKGLIVGPELPDIAPTTKEDKMTNEEENEDGRQ